MGRHRDRRLRLGVHDETETARARPDLEARLPFLWKHCLCPLAHLRMRSTDEGVQPARASPSSSAAGSSRVYLPLRHPKPRVEPCGHAPVTSQPFAEHGDPAITALVALTRPRSSRSRRSASRSSAYARVVGQTACDLEQTEPPASGSRSPPHLRPPRDTRLAPQRALRKSPPREVALLLGVSRGEPRGNCYCPQRQRDHEGAVVAASRGASTADGALGPSSAPRPPRP